MTAVLGALAAVLAIAEAPTLWHGLVGKALPLSVAAVVIGLATAAALLRNLDSLVRVLVAAVSEGLHHQGERGKAQLHARRQSRQQAGAH